MWLNLTQGDHERGVKQTQVRPVCVVDYSPGEDKRRKPDMLTVFKLNHSSLEVNHWMRVSTDTKRGAAACPPVPYPAHTATVVCMGGKQSGNSPGNTGTMCLCNRCDGRSDKKQ